MKLEGLHHVTCITGDAPANVEFYVRVMGLRMVKKTVNQDDPTVYHLFYADEQGSPGADLTFFEYPGATRGTDGAGMVHRIVWRVGAADTLDFWQRRLGEEGLAVERGEDSLSFEDPEGLGLELRVSDASDPPLRAEAPDIPSEHAILGFDGVRAYASDPAASASLLGDALAFEPLGDGAWEARGSERGGFYRLDPAPGQPGSAGAGTVHHVAWNSRDEDHEEWRERAIRGGARPTPVIDRFWFRSIYFREPSGVLFEIATQSPGFTVDESLETLGETLVLPPFLEERREEIERTVTPLPSPASLRSS